MFLNYCEMWWEGVSSSSSAGSEQPLSSLCPLLKQANGLVVVGEAKHVHEPVGHTLGDE